MAVSFHDAPLMKRAIHDTSNDVEICFTQPNKDTATHLAWRMQFLQSTLASDLRTDGQAIWRPSSTWRVRFRGHQRQGHKESDFFADMATGNHAQAMEDHTESNALSQHS